MKAARLATACAFAAVLSACLVPPFDAGLGLAYTTASKMKEIADIGPVSFSRGSAAGGSVTYLPSQTVFATDPPYSGAAHGVLVAAGDYGAQVWYLDQDPSAGPQVYGSLPFNLDSTDHHLYNWQIFMVKTAAGGSTDYFVIQRQGSGTLDLARYDRSTRSLQILSSGSWSSVTATTGSLAGFSYLAIRNEASFLVEDAGAYSEHLAMVTETGWTDLGGAGTVTLPGAPSTGFYQCDPLNGRSILSWWTGSGWATCKWSVGPALPPTMLPTGARIDALLSDGSLYHRGDVTDYVYDWNGERIHSFPVGDLRLVGERDVGGVPTLVYTLVYWENKSGGGDDRLRVKVYTIPTADLDELD